VRADLLACPGDILGRQRPLDLIARPADADRQVYRQQRDIGRPSARPLELGGA
jgi:hypothetical protein